MEMPRPRVENPSSTDEGPDSNARAPSFGEATARGDCLACANDTRRQGLRIGNHSAHDGCVVSCGACPTNHARTSSWKPLTASLNSWTGAAAVVVPLGDVTS